MELLSYKTLEEQKYDGYLLKEAPEKLLQFGGRAHILYHGGLPCGREYRKGLYEG